MSAEKSVSKISRISAIFLPSSLRGRPNFFPLTRAARRTTAYSFRRNDAFFGETYSYGQGVANAIDMATPVTQIDNVYIQDSFTGPNAKVFSGHWRFYNDLHMMELGKAYTLKPIKRINPPIARNISGIITYSYLSNPGK